VLKPRKKHLSEDSLELYSLGRLSGEDLARVEEHLPVCQECRDRLKETVAYTTAMRDALRKIAETDGESGGPGRASPS